MFTNISISLSTLLIAIGFTSVVHAKSSSSFRTNSSKPSFTRATSNRSMKPAETAKKKQNLIHTAAQKKKKESQLSTKTEYEYFPLGDCQRFITASFNGWKCIDRF